MGSSLTTMISQSAQRIRLLIPISRQTRFFATSPPRPAQNRIFSPIRTPEELHTLTFLSPTDNRPLITLWTASWCSTCKAVAPLIRNMIEDEGVGQREGGLGYAEVQMDSTLIGDLPMICMITSMPTLLAFSRQEAQLETKITRPEQMRDKQFLREWLIKEAQRGGRAGGSGGSAFGGWFGR